MSKLSTDYLYFQQHRVYQVKISVFKWGDSEISFSFTSPHPVVLVYLQKILICNWILVLSNVIDFKLVPQKGAFFVFPDIFLTEIMASVFFFYPFSATVAPNARVE